MNFHLPTIHFWGAMLVSRRVCFSVKMFFYWFFWGFPPSDSDGGSLMTDKRNSNPKNNKKQKLFVPVFSGVCFHPTKGVFLFLGDFFHPILFAEFFQSKTLSMSNNTMAFSHSSSQLRMAELKLRMLGEISFISMWCKSSKALFQWLAVSKAPGEKQRLDSMLQEKVNQQTFSFKMVKPCWIPLVKFVSRFFSKPVFIWANFSTRVRDYSKSFWNMCPLLYYVLVRILSTVIFAGGLGVSGLNLYDDCTMWLKLIHFAWSLPQLFEVLKIPHAQKMI